MFTGKAFLKLSNLIFLSYLIKVLILKKVLISSVGLHFQIHMHSQPFPTFAIWHKPCESSNVMAEEKRTKSFYTQLQLLVLNRYTNTMSYDEWKRQLYWPETDFEMSGIQINWNKGDLDCYWSIKIYVEKRRSQCYLE